MWNKRNRHLAALRTLFITQVFQQAMFFPWIQSFVWMQVLHTPERWLLQVKTLLHALSCTRLLSEHRRQALDSCLSRDAISQFVLWWPAVGIAGWPCQPPAVPAAGTSCHSLRRGLSSAVWWQQMSVTGSQHLRNMVLFIPSLKMPVGYMIQYCMGCSFVSKKACVDGFYLLIYKFL